MCEDCGKQFEEGAKTIPISTGFICEDCYMIEVHDDDANYYGEFA